MFLLSTFLAFVSAEGYLCPYSELGYDGNNAVIYDYYDSFDGGATWTRLGETGFINWESYCSAKGDSSIHFDAGEAKCVDSVNKCVWTGSSCTSNLSADPDCFELCQAVLNDEGLECLGGDCGSRETFYAICDGTGGETGGETEIQTLGDYTCEWIGHCLGSSCGDFNDCDGELICVDSRCNFMDNPISFDNVVVPTSVSSEVPIVTTTVTAAVTETVTVVLPNETSETVTQTTTETVTVVLPNETSETVTQTVAETVTVVLPNETSETVTQTVTETVTATLTPGGETGMYNAVGTPCEDDDGCSGQLFCNSGSCSSKLVLVSQGMETNCDCFMPNLGNGTTIGSFCVNNESCDEGLFCSNGVCSSELVVIGAPISTGICICMYSEASVGSTCVTFNDCFGDLVCNDGMCGSPNV